MSDDIDTSCDVISEPHQQAQTSSRGRRRFVVRSLGWTVLDDDDDDDRCVHSSVSKSINRLSLGRHDMTHVVT